MAGLIEDNQAPGVFYGGTQGGHESDRFGTLFRLVAVEGDPQLETRVRFTGGGAFLVGGINP